MPTVRPEEYRELGKVFSEITRMAEMNGLEALKEVNGIHAVSGVIRAAGTKERPIIAFITRPPSGNEIIWPLASSEGKNTPATGDLAGFIVKARNNG